MIDAILIGRLIAYFKVERGIPQVIDMYGHRSQAPPPAKLLSKQGSSRCSGLIVNEIILRRETGYQELARVFLVTAAMKHTVVRRVVLQYSFEQASHSKKKKKFIG